MTNSGNEYWYLCPSGSWIHQQFSLNWFYCYLITISSLNTVQYINLLNRFLITFSLYSCIGTSNGFFISLVPNFTFMPDLIYALLRIWLSSWLWLVCMMMMYCFFEFQHYLEIVFDYGSCSNVSLVVFIYFLTLGYVIYQFGGNSLNFKYVFSTSFSLCSISCELKTVSKCCLDVSVPQFFVMSE